MADKEDIKEKTRKIYEVLPKLDDQRCGYKTCVFDLPPKN
jgi:hypothetical protein